MEGLDVSHQGADVAERSSALRALFSLPITPAATAAETTTTTPTSKTPRYAGRCSIWAGPSPSISGGLT